MNRVRATHRAGWICAVVALGLGACGGPPPLMEPTDCSTIVTVEVTAHGLEHTGGEVRVALFAAEEGFPMEPDPALRSALASIQGTIATVSFADVPCGVYALSVFHDENANGEMETDFLGRPQEGWGVSNDAKSKYRAPRFDEASFVAREGVVRIDVTMNY